MTKVSSSYKTDKIWLIRNRFVYKDKHFSKLSIDNIIVKMHDIFELWKNDMQFLRFYWILKLKLKIKIETNGLTYLKAIITEMNEF